ncbi:hypothetical protein BU24DRAFT_452662 [Aaosphaeria arxii CBS 175.79]|uniref:Uncharacterized protein n=1 Tax=Aaosphaeria arxii CBS 175.79 TaxID=1450172 RepID=A0A6A5XL35_9PLEO|nr:uncharacterized protein BU24DRAFT_452662 [Aaosphaeria arxii CBS 175.79]KAF2013852.1 hypothetical protein BU24DRAFT_452662 [Aaosphaeria arxii CBS 175.79]
MDERVNATVWFKYGPRRSYRAAGPNSYHNDQASLSTQVKEVVASGIREGEFAAVREGVDEVVNCFVTIPNILGNILGTMVDAQELLLTIFPFSLRVAYVVEASMRCRFGKLNCFANLRAMSTTAAPNTSLSPTYPGMHSLLSDILETYPRTNIPSNPFFPETTGHTYPRYPTQYACLPACLLHPCKPSLRKLQRRPAIGPPPLLSSDPRDRHLLT